ncbi:MAG: maleylacetoacetate isomerase [Myxococcales bacterium 68-20]|nr:maleylacetoacetate isomerase [Myxococcales bacterium]OJY26675.1 MAG: maleylacetoacetate isomerase [Myxococcales bacterium 68-20]
MPNLTLYTYWRSSASHRVRIALGYKGLTYDPVYVNLLEGEQRKDEYKQTNPMGHLPCLVIDGVKYVESTAIIELLEELYPEPALLPKKPEDRARVRALVQIVNSGIQPLQNLVVLDRIGEDKEKRLDWLRHFITRGLTAWEALASRYAEETGQKGPFAYGATFTAADAVLIPQLYTARRFGIDLSPYPTILRMDEATKDLPFVKAAYPDAQPDAKP